MNLNKRSVKTFKFTKEWCHRKLVVYYISFLCLVKKWKINISWEIPYFRVILWILNMLKNFKVRINVLIYNIFYHRKTNLDKLQYYWNKTTFFAISLEVKPLAALYPPSCNFFRLMQEKGANAVGLFIPPPATTKSASI